MSSPGQFILQGENLHYGFLAAKATDAIQLKIDGGPLKVEDEQVLEKANAFLIDVVKGASLVCGASFSGHSAQVVTALRYATNPIRNLQKAISSNEELSEYFTDMAEALTAQKADTDELLLAQEFFELMVRSLRNAISHNQPPLGSFDGSIPELQQVG